MGIAIYKNENLVDEFDYTEFKQLSFREKEKIYKLKHNEGCNIVCDCIDKGLELTVAKRNDNIYLKNNPGNGEKHDHRCRLYSNYTGDNEYESGWKFDEEEGIIEANIPSSLFGITKKKKDGEQDGGGRRISISSGKGITRSKVTLLGLMCKLDIMSWDTYVSNKEKTPENIEVFLRQVFGTSRFIKIKGKSCLQNYWFKFNKIKELKTNEFIFVFMPLIKCYSNNSKYYYNIELAQFIDGEVKKVTISCKTELLQEALNSIRNVANDYQNEEFSTIVGGFVKKNSKGFLQFVSLEFMPIIKQGLWAESAYEKQIYDKLINEERLFTKGYEAIEFYNNFVPDIIFKDTKKPYIGEVFGIRNIETYNERKKEKIELSRLKDDKFDFWYWDVTESNIPPEFKSKE